MMKECFFYDKLKEKKVRCNTCYRHCEIADGGVGFCRIRKNENGRQYLTTYGKAFEPSIDPIEKKPFYHFHPGAETYSFCTPGCNFSCLHCQNWELARGTAETIPCVDLSPKEIVSNAVKAGTNIISYTYTEPTVFFEYAYDTGVVARSQHMENTFVTNGYATPEVVKKSKDFLDAVRIDLKGDAQHYKKVCGNVILENVLECIKNYWKITKNLEIITLVIEGDNDSKDFVCWAADFLKEMSDEIPWHFIACFPAHKMMNIKRTSVQTLTKMHDWAKDEGMKYVYTGNVSGKYNNTYCPNCNELLIERNYTSFGMYVKKHIEKPRCPKCGQKIPIIL